MTDTPTPEDDEITLDEFTIDVLNTLHDFRTSWQNGIEDAPDIWPGSMPPADWWEQFHEHDPEAPGG